MQSFADFSQGFAVLYGISQKNADNFFPQVFYDVNWTLNLFFSLETRKTRKKSTGSTGNTGIYLKYICTGNTELLKVFQVLCFLEKPYKIRRNCTNFLKKPLSKFIIIFILILLLFHNL